MNNKFIILLKPSLNIEKIICRLISAWLTLTFINSFTGTHFELAFKQDSSILYIAIASLTVFIVYTMVNVLFNNKEIDSWLLLLFSTLCVFKWLITDNSYVNSFLYTLAVIAVYLIFIFYVLNKNENLIERFNFSKFTTFGLITVFALICAFVISIITCFRHLTFSTPNFDFGLFVNMFHNMREKGIPLSTSERDVLLSHFAVHISSIYYLILPFYFIFPSPLTLQISQALILASGVIPLVMICRNFKLSNKLTAVMSIIYSLYPAISAGTFYDIHENCFLLPLLLWTFYFFEREKYLFMYIFAFLTLMVKEDAAIYIMIFALFVILSRKKYLHGSVLLIVSAAYFLFAVNLLDLMGNYYAGVYADATANPEINGAMVNRFDNLIYNESDGIIGVVKTAVKNPGYLLTQLFETGNDDYGKIKYILQMFLPLGFIPFITKKISRYILIAPILINLLTDYIYQYDIGFQYHFGISAFLIYLTVMNLSELKAPSKKTMITIGSVACCCLYLTTVSPKLSVYMTKWSEEKESYREMEAILETIPKDASVCASTMLVSHLADREEIYQIEYHNCEPDTDYVIFDTRYETDSTVLNTYLSKGYYISGEYENLLILEKEK